MLPSPSVNNKSKLATDFYEWRKLCTATVNCERKYFRRKWTKTVCLWFIGGFEFVVWRSSSSLSFDNFSFYLFYRLHPRHSPMMPEMFFSRQQQLWMIKNTLKAGFTRYLNKKVGRNGFLPWRLYKCNLLAIIAYHLFFSFIHCFATNRMAFLSLPSKLLLVPRTFFKIKEENFTIAVLKFF